MTQTSKVHGMSLLPCLTALMIALPFGAATAQSTAADNARPAAEQAAREGIDALNRKEVEACQNMDQAASAALWADDGVDLIQGLQPMVGKAVIAAWLNSLTPQLKGAKMVYCTIDWRQLTIRGDLAYEWGINRQKILFPPPQKSFENVGKITLVLKRQPGGEWKIALESWNSSPVGG